MFIINTEEKIKNPQEWSKKKKCIEQFTTRIQNNKGGEKEGEVNQGQGGIINVKVTDTQMRREKN